MNKNPKGFTAVEGLLILVIVSIIGFTGWYVWQSKQTTEKSLNTSANHPIAVRVTKKPSTQNQAANQSNVSTPSPSSNTSTQQTQQPAATPSPNVSAETGSLNVTYRVAADGNSSQASPTLGKFTGKNKINIIVDLQCIGTCQFQLMSDNYTLSNTTVYASSQKITYTVTQPGKWTFYDKFTHTGFLLEF